MARGEIDLGAILRSLGVRRRPGVFTFVSVDAPSAELFAAAAAIVVEDEGVTLVLPVDDARRAGLAFHIEAAWLTLSVHTALEGVGFTAAFSRALADAGIPCNVLAGANHDHILVPVTRADDAIAALLELSASGDGKRHLKQTER